MQTQAQKKGRKFSALTNREDVAKVLDYPQLVIEGDAEGIWEMTGVHTSAKYLERLKNRITQQSLCSDIISEQSSKDLCKRLTNHASTNVPREAKMSKLFTSKKEQVTPSCSCDHATRSIIHPTSDESTGFRSHLLLCLSRTLGDAKG